LLKQGITDFLKDLVVPPVCAVCGKISADYLCSSCISRIIPLGRGIICSYCGVPLADIETGLCRLCRTEEYHFTAHRSYAQYAGNMKKIIRKFKYRKVYELKNILTEFLSDLYYQYFSGKDIDYIDTVPGEHTDMLAGCFSKKHRIPFTANITRIRKPERQGGLGLAERRINILDCFKLRDCLSYNNKSVLVIDDVWTTGSTLREVTRAIRSGGASDVYLLTLARRI
jgi:predicted amidophosphoribosyltransferase